jgi:hypothetical protein
VLTGVFANATTARLKVALQLRATVRRVQFPEGPIKDARGAVTRIPCEALFATNLHGVLRLRYRFGFAKR